MASNTYGAIKLSTAEDVGAVLKKKTGSADGYKPKEWAGTINLLGLLPIRTASGTIAHFSDGAEDVPMKSVVANIVPIQEGTGTPSPSNPRPISGTSVLNVEQRGVNLFDEDLEEGFINATTGEPQPYSNRMRSKYFNTIKPSTTYYIKCGNNEETYWYFYDSQKNYLRRRLVRNSTTTTQADENYFKVGIVGISSYSDDISLNYPSTDTDYHAYIGQTCTIDLGQEILGGMADVVGGVGESTHGNLDLSSLEWTYSSAYQRFSTASQVAGIKTPPNNNTVANILCSHFNSDTSNNTAEVGKDNIIGVSMTGVIQIRDTSLNGDISALMTLLENVDFAYELATPTDFTFTGQPINSYLGVNNVWTDRGEVLDVEYRADMNILIAELGG